jgi:glycosyltransferase involved in cell wall biosynthesis
MNNKVKLSDYEKLELKYNVLKEKYSLLMHILNSRMYRKFFAKYLSFSRKLKGLSLKDMMPKYEKKTGKPKIALIIDKEDWAFANIATQIVNNLSEYYDFYVIQTDIIDKIEDVLLIIQDCDLVHFFWRGFLYESIDEYNLIYATEKLGVDYKMFLDEFVKNLNISTCVYDHMFLRESEIKITKKITDLTNNYYVSSNILKDIYDKLPINNKPVQVITDGVDLDKFKPSNLKRFSNIADRNIVIGWVGNSKWGDHDKKLNDAKGVNTILKPAIKQLIKEGYKVEMFLADRNIRMIPHDKMVDYYNKIDLYVCTSETEGTPNPALEAMACGVPVISTNVGVIKDLFGIKQQKFILEERSVECLKEKIVSLIKNTDEFSILSEENLESIKAWSWENKCKDFKEYFDRCLNGVK